MKKTGVYLYALGIILIVNMYGCSFVNTQTRSENTAEIELSSDGMLPKSSEERTSFSEGDLKMMFEAVNNEPVVSFFYNDYNKDGIFEAFVLTKTDTCKLWHMSAQGCKIVQQGLKEVDEDTTGILSFQTRDYLLLQQKINGKQNTLIFSLGNEEEVITANLSGNGYFYQNEEGELFLEVNDGLGGKTEENTFCTYYFYYILDEGFKEYGAIPINQEQFLEFEGAEEILNSIYEQYSEYEVECTFLYRSNHYIDINVALWKDGRQKNKHLALIYDTREVRPVTDDLMDGKIENAFMLELATFPTAFKHPMNQIIE